MFSSSEVLYVKSFPFLHTKKNMSIEMTQETALSTEVIQRQKKEQEEEKKNQFRLIRAAECPRHICLLRLASLRAMTLTPKNK